MKLEDRCAQVGSTVNFYSENDARTFYKDQLLDIVLMRHPGPVAEACWTSIWKDITQTMLETRPALLFLSTYLHEVEDPMVKDMIDVLTPRLTKK